MIFAACSTTSEPVTTVQTVVEVPPVALVRPCSKPYRAVTTTGELVARLTAVEGALNVCAAQVAAIRQWREDTLQRYSPPDTE